MMRQPNTPLFMILLVAAASLFPAEAYSQHVEAAGGGSKPVHPGNFNAGLGMDYWAGDWGNADIHRWGASAWASTSIWHCLGINAEGHSMIAGGNRIASHYKLFVGEGGLMCTVRAWDRFQPIYKGGLGFASLTQPGDGRGKFHSTYSIWSFGAGVDIHTGGRWWTRVEYTYEGFPNFYSGITHQYHTLNPQGITIGMTYHFGAPKTRFPEPVVVDQETQNLPGPYTANRRSVTKPNAPTPDTATGTPVAKPNAPAPATESRTPVNTPDVPTPATVPETPAPQADMPAPASAPGTSALNPNMPALAPAPGTPAPKADVPALAPAPPKAKVHAPAPAPGTPAPKAKVPALATATGTPGGKIPAIDTSRFVLGPSDVIHVDVSKNTELSQTVIVAPDGFISLRLLNNVHVAGMTAGEVAQALRSKLTDYIVNPQVTVSVVAVHSREVFVMGQVAKPGSFPLLGPLNVLQVIALAGGLTPSANHNGIMILRDGKDGSKKIRFNYNNVVRGDRTQNVFLRPGDIVVVP